MSRVVVKKEIIRTSPISNTSDLSSNLEKLTINDSNVIETTTARCVLISSITSLEGEIFAVNPESVIEEKLSLDSEQEDEWDSLIEQNFAAPFVVPRNTALSIFAIYDSDFAYEYRIVIDETQRDYYLGTGIKSPYNNIRYVFIGYLNSYPNLILAEPGYFSSYNTASDIDLLIQERKITALSLDRSVNSEEPEYTTVEIYAVYGVGLGDRIPIEYRLVFDVDRRNFYSANSIDTDQNYKILESENTERITSDGYPVVNRSFYENM